MSVVSCPLSVVVSIGCVSGAAMAATAFKKLDVYRMSERLADQIWTMSLSWDPFAKDTVGKQLVRAADSIGANIAEAVGRGSFQDNRRFVRVARGSLNETMHWLRRAYKRDLLSKEQASSIRPLMDELAPRLNAYLKSIGSSRGVANGQPAHN
jgi:four helix bundle protein